jgi:nitrate/nitrite transporter NarK
VILVSLGLASAFFANSCFFSLNADLFKYNAASAQGITSSFFAFSGIVSPAVTGALIQHTGNFKWAIFLVAILCVCACANALFFQRVRLTAT